MADASAALPEAVIAAIHADAVETYQAWKTTATEEQKQKGIESLEKMMTDEEFRNTKMAKAAEIFGQADVNGDGVLDAAEYETYMQLNNAEADREGQWKDERPGRAAQGYALGNMINPEREGISMQEQFTVFGPYMAKWNELKAADGM